MLSLELQRLRCGSCLIPAANKLPPAFGSALKPSLSAPQQLRLQCEGHTSLLLNRVFILLIVTENTSIQFRSGLNDRRRIAPVITSVGGGYDGAARRANCLKWAWSFDHGRLVVLWRNDSMQIETKEVKWNTWNVKFVERECVWDVPSVLFSSKNSPVALNYDGTQLTHKAKYESHINLLNLPW